MKPALAAVPRLFLRAASAACAILLFGPMSAATTACDSAPVRNTIVLFDYSGAEHGEARNQYSLFKAALRDKIQVWFDELAELRSSAPFLRDLTLHPAGGPLPDTLAGPADVEKYWRSTRALELLRGGILPDNGSYSVKSRIYLGELSAGLGSTSVSVSLPITAGEFANANDSHSLVTYFALAMEAKRLNCPPGVRVGLLGKALEKAADLTRRNMGDAEIERVVNAIEAELETAMAGQTP
jgi:hypothetical protein